MIWSSVLIFLASICCIQAYIPIQSHSFNDIDYIQNLIRRGVDVYKMDVSLADRYSCQKFSTWNNTQKCIQVSQFIQQICCLSLRGDGSSQPQFNYHFNTSKQFIKMLDRIMPNIIINQPKRKLIFVLNFQFSFSFANNLVENFMLSFVDLLQKYSKNLYIGFGSDNFILEYDRVCYGAGEPECTETRRRIAKSSFFLQSSAASPFDPRDHSKRFRNFNVFYKGIDHFCEKGFPAWINNHPELPLIFWEPSNEKQVQHVVSQFLSPGCAQKHGRNLSGLAIATNLDPEMVDIYMKKTVETATTAGSVWPPASEKALMSEQINLRLARFSSGSTPNTEIVYTASNSLLTNKLVLQRIDYDEKTKLMRVAARRELSLLRFGESVNRLLQVGTYLVLVTESTGEDLSTVYYFEASNMTLANSLSWARMDAVCTRGDELIYVTCSQTISCSIKGTTNTRDITDYGTLSLGHLLSKVTSIETSGAHFLLLGESSSTEGLAVAAVIKDGALVVPGVPLSFGRRPHIIKRSAAGGDRFAVILSDSMCSSAVHVNNNNYNKCNFFNQPQFLTLRNVPNIVTLMQFNISDLIKNSKIISPCDKYIKFSKVWVGNDLDIIPLENIESYLLTSEYVTIQRQDLCLSIFCGGANFNTSYKYKLPSSIISTMYFTK